MRNWFYRFMAGRYGSDRLNFAIIVLWMILAVINIFVHSTILYALNFVFVILCFYRMFSRNIYQRSRENETFEHLYSKVKGRLHLQILKIQQFKTHRFFRCPACKATIRIPKQKGSLHIRCTKCGHEFQKTIRF